MINYRIGDAGDHIGSARCITEHVNETSVQLHTCRSLVEHCYQYANYIKSNTVYKTCDCMQEDTTV